MRSIPMYLLLPLTALAGTAIPIDPARAAGLVCVKVVVHSAPAKAVAASDTKAPRKSAWRPTLEAL
jgi:hypothetical protein